MCWKSCHLKVMCWSWCVVVFILCRQQQSCILVGIHLNLSRGMRPKSTNHSQCSFYWVKVMQQHALFYLIDNKQYSLWIWAFETCRAITTSQFPSLPKCCGSKWTANSSLFWRWTHVSNRTLRAVSDTSQRESACWTGADRGTRGGTAVSCRTVLARWGTLW